MRIAFFDGLLESHVPESLERAFIARGHTVHNTGKIGHGYFFESRPTHLAGIEQAIDDVLSFVPDLVLVFRPASLPPAQLSRLKKSKALVAVWLSDDPVLWDLSYRPVVDLYDVVLNCGSERVLSFYDEHFGRPVGMNMPFWTDNVAFPYVYGKNEPESTAMFLGNVQDEVRRRRYYALGDLATDVRIHGNTGIDFNNLAAGYLDSDSEVVSAASRALLAVNIPQFFSDHRGLATWFDGLGDLGTFQYPSRVIQYAAMGLPIVSVTPTPDDYDTFPEMTLVPNYSDIDQAIDSLLGDNERLQQLSRDTYSRFAKHFSAKSRAIALESLLVDDSWRDMGLSERARWFTRFDGQSLDEVEPDASRERLVVEPGDAPVPHVDISDNSRRASDSRVLKVVLVGKPPSSAASSLSTAERALSRLGHSPTVVTVDSHPGLFRKDSSREFEAFLDVHSLLNFVDADAIILFGHNYVISLGGRKLLDDHGIPIIVHSVKNRSLNISNAKLAARSDVLTVSHPDLLRSFVAAGFTDTVLARGLVDSSFIEAADAILSAATGIRSVAPRRRDLSAQKFLMQDLLTLNSSFSFVDEQDAAPHSVSELVEFVRAAITVVGDDTSLPGTQASELFPFALAAGGLVVVPRTPGIASRGVAGETHFTARDRSELIRKLVRLRSDFKEYAKYLTNARAHVRDFCMAEDYFSMLLTRAFESRNQAQVSNSFFGKISSLPSKGVLASRSWKVNSTALHGSRITLVINYSPPSRHENLALIRFQIRLGETLVGSARLSDMLGESELVVDIPSRAKPGALSVELYSDDALPFFNWNKWIDCSVDLSQVNVSGLFQELALGANRRCFSLDF